jgi:hypothetical protein
MNKKYIIKLAYDRSFEYSCKTILVYKAVCSMYAACGPNDKEILCRYRNTAVPTGGIRQNLFENYYFKKLHAPRARGARVCARAEREGRRNESTVNNKISGSKLKIRQTGALGNLPLFPSMGRGTRESKYPRRKVGNSNCTKSWHMVACPPL